MNDKLMLMIPGPTPVPEQALLALAKHPIGHRSSEFAPIMAECTENLKWLHQTQNDVLMLTASVVGFRVIAVPPEQDVNDGKTAAYAKSRVTYKSADGLTCRQLEFDNRTGLAREGKPEPCYQGPPAYRQRSFIWGR